MGCRLQQCRLVLCQVGFEAEVEQFRCWLDLLRIHPVDDLPVHLAVNLDEGFN